MPISRFDCASSSLALKALLRRTKRVLWGSLTAGVAYDPIEYRGKIVILRVNGTVSTLRSESELERILAEQQAGK